MRINFTRGLKVIPDQWDSMKQRAIVSHRLPEIYNMANEFTNAQLDQDELKFQELVTALSENPEKITTFAQIIRETFMPRKTNTATKATKPDIFKEIKNAVINDSSINEGTQYNYLNKGLKAFQAFCAYRSSGGDGEIESFDMINNDLIAEFFDYLKDGKYKQDNGLPYAMGTLNSIIKYAVGAIKCLPAKFLSPSRKALLKTPQLTDKTATNNEIALTDVEILKLRAFVPESEGDREILDMFLLECTTGQRVSDLPKVGASMQERYGILFITIVQEKTSKKIEVPIKFQLAKDILLRYKSGLPKVGKDKINKNIKRIAQEAGIIGTETVSRHYSGSDKPTVTKHERSDLISSHTGRRTFVSLLSVRGWNYEEIAKYTGHTNIKTVQGYDKSTAMDREAFNKLADDERLKFTDEVANIKKVDASAESRAKNAVDVLIEAGHLLGIPLAPKGRLNLLSLSKIFQSEKDRIVAEYGEGEYQKLRNALQFGRTPEEQDLLGRFFCHALPKWFNRPVIITGFDSARRFWQKVQEEEQRQSE